MSTALVFIIAAVILLFVVIYRNSNGEKLYSYITKKTDFIYKKVAPYTYQEMREKTTTVYNTNNIICWWCSNNYIFLLL